MKKLLGILNEPFVLWLLSSVVVGLVSWQYAEIQKNSVEQKLEEQALRRARLELKLLLRDVQFVANQGENLTVGHLNGLLLKLQYNAAGPLNQFYFPAVLNVMLEIDQRSGSCGLERFQDRLYGHATGVSDMLTRLVFPGIQPTTVVASRLSPEERESLGRLVDLSEEILGNYPDDESDCSLGSRQAL